MAPNCSLRGEFAIEVKIPKVAESMPRPGAAKWTALFTLNHPPGIIDAACYPNYNTSFSGSVWQIGTPGTGNITTTAYLNKAAFVDPPAYTGATSHARLRWDCLLRTTRMWTSASAESSCSPKG